MAVGAYASAALSVYVGAPLLHSAAEVMPPALARALYFVFPLALGGLAAGIAGIAVGIPTLRLRGDYLAIATLGFGEIMRIAILNIDTVGGARGFSLSAPRDAGVELRYEGIGAIYAVVCLGIAVVSRLAHSGGGLAFRAVGTDETAAESIGIATTRVKVEAFAISSFLAGVAGALFAHSEGYIHTNSFSFVRSFEIVVFVVLGGLGSISGAILAAAVLTAAPELLRGVGEWRMILYALLLIAAMLLRPQGLLGNRELVPWRWPARGGGRSAPS
jgi:branched-chain amino acid transport system permease protein